MISDEQSPAARESQHLAPKAEEDLAALSEIAIRIKELRENAPEIHVERVWTLIKDGLQPRS